uniref:Uncharacterized protein n=1 Tax=Rhizophagus irregularis (strain DAOM 181602 / DAOM 197198 / MUCL 43194) TaxID=747089 RepID=U9U3X6_RHIID
MWSQEPSLIGVIGENGHYVTIFIKSFGPVTDIANNEIFFLRYTVYKIYIDGNRRLRDGWLSSKRLTDVFILLGTK